MDCDKLAVIEELPKITVLESSIVTRTSVRMEQHVRTILRTLYIINTSGLFTWLHRRTL